VARKPSSITVIVVLSLAALAAEGAEPLFPRPLHLTRQVDDPVSGVSSVVDEYFAGNRAVSIAGDVTAIVDYAKGESLRIDRAAGTFSIATLEELARAARAGRSRAAAGSVTSWSVRAVGPERRGSRDVILYRAAESADPGQRRGRIELEIAIDRGVALTRAGAEVLAGAAYPSERAGEADAIFRAAAGEGAVAAAGSSQRQTAHYGLPLETTLVWRDGEEEIRFMNRVVRVGGELAPAAALQVPRGARQVEDPRIATAALLEALDQEAKSRE
jgi:hypothetical protein